MLRHPALLLVGQRVAGQQHVAEAEDAVERRAQLVAHRGQEVALEPVRFVQGQVGLGQFVDLAIEVGVHLAPLVLHADEVAQHAVEGMAQVLELVAGLDFAADIELAGGDGVGDFLQMLDRLDDDVADDDPAADHDEHGGAEAVVMSMARFQWTPSSMVLVGMRMRTMASRSLSAMASCPFSLAIACGSSCTRWRRGSARSRAAPGRWGLPLVLGLAFAALEVLVEVAFVAVVGVLVAEEVDIDTSLPGSLRTT